MVQTRSMSAGTRALSANARPGFVSDQGSSSSAISPRNLTRLSSHGVTISQDWPPAVSPFPSIGARSKANATCPSGRKTHADISA